MSRPQSQPQVLFSLKPVADSERAENVVDYKGNDPLRLMLDDGTRRLGIGHVPPKSNITNTLAILGGDDTSSDIVIECASIAKTQCSFEINPETNVVMFCDKSPSGTCQVFGQNATPFEHDRPLRRVVVQKNLNTIIGMGGEKRNLIQFELVWHHSLKEMMELVKARESALLDDYPHMSQNLGQIHTFLPSRMETRVHIPGPRQPRMRYAKLSEQLGSGQFGEVYKAIDVDSGNIMAVKILKSPAGVGPHISHLVKREIEILSSTRHPHVVDYITSQGWDREAPEIFMGLKEGSVNSLMARGYPRQMTTDLAKTILHQMLQAIDYLAVKGIIHRDVKPDNILYQIRPDGQFHFQLGDFGLSNRIVGARTFAGTHPYLAPEIFHGGHQTHKADVWSLAVAMLWTLDVEGFRHFSTRCNGPYEVQQVVLFFASRVKHVPAVREMATLDPEERPSAAQLLVEYYHGQGLVTPRHRVPPLTRSTNAHSGH